MRKILIATRNKDKFEIMKKIFGEVSEKNFLFFNLNDLNIDVDVCEIGNILERAEQKAREVFDIAKYKVDAIIGIDDGIKIKEIITTETKKEADKIISENYLDIGEVVYIVRGCFIINTKSCDFESCLNEIPFKFMGLDNSVERKEGMFPLSYVLARVDCDKTISCDDELKSHNYYMKYSKNELKNIFEVL